MNPRTAMKETLKFILNNLDVGNAENISEQMHDDTNFLERLEEFVGEYLEDFGDNYGL